ncbi:MAG: hypothetical protein WCI05_05395, partial [Myxococcales bacterium]
MNLRMPSALIVSALIATSDLALAQDLRLPIPLLQPPSGPIGPPAAAPGSRMAQQLSESERDDSGIG